MDIDRALKAVEAIAYSLGHMIDPHRGGKPSGDGVLKLLERIATALDRGAPRGGFHPLP